MAGHVRPLCDVLQQRVDFCYEAWCSKSYVMAAAAHVRVQSEC